MIPSTRPRPRRLAALAAVAALAASFARSAPALADSSPPTSAPAARRELRLSLEDALTLALRGNQDIALARLAPRRAAAEVTRAQGLFDPILSLLASIDRDHTPSGTKVLGSFMHTARGEASLGGRLPWGTTYDLRYGTDRRRTDGQLVPFSPVATSRVTLTIEQPLLRGFGSDVNRAGITVARGNERIAEASMRRATEVALADTVDAYWRLVRAHQALGVAHESLQLARELAERTQLRVQAGDAPTLDLTQARTSIAAREEAVILAQAEVGNANDALARRLVVDPREVFDVTIVPTDEPAELATGVHLAGALETALARRPELAAARQAIANAEVALRAARNGRLPELSAVGSVGSSGLDRDWGDSTTQLGRELDDQYRWSVGVVLRVPLGNRSADGAHRAARLALDEARLAQRRLELEITEQVRVAIRAVDANAQRVEATRRAAELARDQLAAAQKRQATGLATAFEVLRLQTDLAAAQNAAITAATEYRSSLVRVHLATGGLGEQLGLR